MIMKAFYGRSLVLPKSGLHGIASVKKSLDFAYKDTIARAWSEDADFIYVPREFIPVDSYGRLPFPVENVCPSEYPQIPEVRMTHGLRTTTQEEACKALLSGNGILVLGCGRGKTVIALHAWSAYRVPGFIVVPTIDLAHQWKDRILEHTDLSENEIGWVQGSPDKWSWENKYLTIGILNTVANYERSFTEAFYHWYGVFIYDEVHRLGAPMFNVAASIGFGLRWGLSATPLRADGLDIMYRYHLGDVLYENSSLKVEPEIYFLRLETEFDSAIAKRLSVKGELHYAKLINWLAGHTMRTTQLIALITEYLSQDRQILVLSERKSQLQILHSFFPKRSGLLIGSIKGDKRKDILQNNQLVFASLKIAQEGIDKQSLNTILLTSPVSDAGKILQIIGRIRSDIEPKFVVCDDYMVPMVKSGCNKMRRVFNEHKLKHKNMRVLL